MLAAAHDSSSGDILSYEGAIALLSLLATIAGLVLQWSIGKLHRRIVYGMPFSTNMVNSSVSRSDLHILWRDEEVNDPHLLEIELAYRGRVDLSSSSFDKGRPFRLDVGAPIIDLLDIVFHPAHAPLPSVEYEGTELKLGPDLVRKGQTMTFVVLADGPGGPLKCESPLANVKVKQVRYQGREEARGILGWRPDSMQKILIWAILLFIIFYVGTEPDGAAGLVHHMYLGIHNAATSLATFVNSL
jgi:hypothetical protein